jgi:RNA polymerase sigma-70 factor (ECF subfamily)
MTAPGRWFASTRWTLVLAAARETPAAHEAMATLCGLYWTPLYAYARRAGYRFDQAEDLTQAFFARFLEKGDVQAADPRRGRFRSFLLASFKHFLLNEHDRAHTLKRGGHRLVTVDCEAAEARYAAASAHAWTPEALFEREWALGILERGMALLRAECIQAGKATTFAHLEGFIVGDKSAGGYARVARVLNLSDGAIKVTVHRLRRRLRELVKLEVAPTVSDDAEIEAEIQYLFAVLAR